jgi:hypothetical protein
MDEVYWPGLMVTAMNVLMWCEVCLLNNWLNIGGCVFVTTSRWLLILGLDFMLCCDDGLYVFLAIDYFTRMMWTMVFVMKGSMGVIEILDVIMRTGMPDEIFTDNGKVFCCVDVERYCSGEWVLCHTGATGV